MKSLRYATPFLTLALVLALAGAALAQGGGNRQLMSEKMASQDMKRMIMEAVVGFKVKSETRAGQTEDPSYKADSVSAAVIKGIKVDKMIYDKERDIALCYGHLDLDQVINVVGERLKFKGVTVEGFGFGTATPTSRPPLMALRAAMLNAQDEMAKLLVGEKIYSSTSAENFVLTKDINRAKVCAAVFGAYIPNIELNSPNRGWGWDKDGLAFVKLEIDARKVRDVLGNLMVVKGPNVLEVVGRGAVRDDLAEEPGSMVRPSGSKTKYMSLDVPGATEEAPKAAGQ